MKKVLSRKLGSSYPQKDMMEHSGNVLRVTDELSFAQKVTSKILRKEKGIFF